MHVAVTSDGQPRGNSRGKAFTLLELPVVIAIMTAATHRTGNTGNRPTGPATAAPINKSKGDFITSRVRLSSVCLSAWHFWIPVRHLSASSAREVLAPQKDSQVQGKTIATQVCPLGV